MIPPRLFFIDFDGTLFSTESFWTDVQKACVKQLGISEALFLETYARAKNIETVYDIDTHLQLMGISRETILYIFASVFAEKSYIFPDVLPFINDHSEDMLVIVTQGVDWFQHIKVASLFREGLTLRTIVTNYKKRLFIEKTVDFSEGVQWEGTLYKSLTFVDNMADAFLSDGHNGTLLQYRIRRFGDDVHASEPTQIGSVEITTLLEIT